MGVAYSANIALFALL